jgi:hypothetical protein
VTPSGVITGKARDAGQPCGADLTAGAAGADWASGAAQVAATVDTFDPDADPSDNTTTTPVTIVAPPVVKVAAPTLLPFPKNVLTATSGVVKIGVRCPVGSVGCRFSTTLRSTTRVLVGRTKVFVTATCKATNLSVGKAGTVTCTFARAVRTKLSGKSISMRLTVVNTTTAGTATTTRVARVLIAKPKPRR